MTQQTIAQVQCVAWDKVYLFDANSLELIDGDFVVVMTQLGMSVGVVKSVVVEPLRPSTAMMEKLLRKADKNDLLSFAHLEGPYKKEVFLACKKIIRNFSLGMKLVDVYISLDGQRITVAFIANGRIDFRELVKSLVQHFQKSIRLQQIGVRDEAKYISDIGVCGQQTCCTRFLKDLGNVNVEFAEKQQVSHRGSDRLSGVCGRLACCLRYEQETYETLSKDFPPLSSFVQLAGGNRGVVRSWNILKGLVSVELTEQGGIIVVPKDDIRGIISAS